MELEWEYNEITNYFLQKEAEVWYKGINPSRTSGTTPIKKRLAQKQRGQTPHYNI
jgi:hypothetical protein